jgi:hypothetical protein
LKQRVSLTGDSIQIVRNSRRADGAREFVVEGDFDFDVEDLDNYVQVRISGMTGSYIWTYRDPSGILREGDRVIVPFGYENNERLAVVTALGRGSWGGPVKNVFARVLTQELSD